MSPLTTISTVVMLQLAAAAVPGPNFLVVLHTATAGSRRLALRAAVGLATGTALLGAAGVLGVATVLQHAPAVAGVLKVVCGAYLIHLGISTWRTARSSTPASSAELPGVARLAYLRGLSTVIVNPKALVFFSSLVTSAVPHPVSPSLSVALVTAIAMTSLFWNTSLAVVCSTGFFHRFYQRWRQWIEFASAGLFVAVGTLSVFL